VDGLPLSHEPRPGHEPAHRVLRARRASLWLPTGTNLGARFFFAQDEARQPLNPFTTTTASRHSYGHAFSLRRIQASASAGRAPSDGRCASTTTPMRAPR
jgi:hypothetical protein